MNNRPTYLSKDGLEKLRAELDAMTSVKRPEVAQRARQADAEELVPRPVGVGTGREGITR